MPPSSLTLFSPEANAKFSTQKGSKTKKFVLALEEMNFPDAVPDVAAQERDAEKNAIAVQVDKKKESEGKNTKSPKSRKVNDGNGSKKASGKNRSRTVKSPESVDKNEGVEENEAQTSSNVDVNLSSTGDEEDVDNSYEEDVKNAKRLKKMDVVLKSSEAVKSGANDSEEGSEGEYRESEEEPVSDGNEDSYSDYEIESNRKSAKKKEAQTEKRKSAKISSKKKVQRSEAKRSSSEKKRKLHISSSSSKTPKKGRIEEAPPAEVTLKDTVHRLHQTLQLALPAGSQALWVSNVLFCLDVASDMC